MKFWESNHQSVQEGDMQFIALYKFYYQDLYAYGVSLGFNTEDVKDAIQEVYLKLYFNERLCIDEKKIKFYLLRSVRNQLIDWERTKKDTSSIEEEERSFKLSVSVEESFISDEEDLLLKKRVNRILDLLTELNRRKGTTIVMILHDVNLSARYANHLFALCRGKLIAEGKPADVITEELMQKVYQLNCIVMKDPLSGAPLIVPKGKY